MGYKVIQWRDLADFTQSIKLEGVVYSLRARWNSVNEYWTIDLYDRNGNALIIAHKLVLATDILARYPSENLPAGSLYVVDISNQNDPLQKVGRDDMGVNAVLVYAEEGTL